MASAPFGVELPAEVAVVVALPVKLRPIPLPNRSLVLHAFELYSFLSSLSYLYHCFLFLAQYQLIDVVMVMEMEMGIVAAEFLFHVAEVVVRWPNVVVELQL